MSSTPPQTDANGNGGEFDHWLGQHVETENGIGAVVEDHGDTIQVSHAFPTFGVEEGTYAKSNVYLLDDVSQHPANTSLRHHEYEDLKAMDEPQLHYYD